MMTNRVFSVGLVISAAGNVVNFINHARSASERLRTSMTQVGVQRVALDNLRQMRTELTAAQARAAAFEAGLGGIRRNVERSSQLALTFGQRLRRAEDAGRGMTVQLQRAQASLQQATQTSAAFQSALVQAEQKLGNSANLAASLSAKLTAARSTGAATVAEIARLKTELQATGQASTKFATSLVNVDQRLAASEDLAARLAAKIYSAKASGTATTAEIDKLTAALARANAITEQINNAARAQHLRQSLSQAEQAAARSTAEITKLDAALARANTLSTQFQQHVDKAKANLAASVAQVEQLKQKLAQVERTAGAGRAEVDKIKESLTRAERVADQFRNRLTDATRQGSELRREVERTEAALRRANERAQQLRLNPNGPANADALLANHQRSLQMGVTGRDLQERGRDLRASGYGAVIGATAGVYGAVRMANPWIEHEDAMRDVAITGGMKRKDENALGQMVRRAAKDTNQKHADLAGGLSVLVANGMTAADAQKYVPVLGHSATASRAQMKDMANLTFSLDHSMGIKGVKQMQEAIDALNYAGKQGQFELRHMARYFPELGARMKSFGVTGMDAVRELGAAMQVARGSSGTTEEAATNVKDWMSHMTAAHTVKTFHDVGIDYKKEITQRVASGKMSAFMASIDVTDKYIDKVASGKVIEVRNKHGVKDRLDFRAALKQAKETGNEDAVRSVVEQFALSKVFQNMQSVNAYLAFRQNRAQFEDIKKGSGSAEARGSIMRDAAERKETAKEQAKSFGIAVHDLVLGLGRAVMHKDGDGKTGSGRGFVATANEYIGGLSSMIDNNQKLVKTGVAVVAGLAVLSVGFMAMKFLAGGVMGIAGGGMRLWGFLRGKKTGRDVQQVYVVNMGDGNGPDVRLRRGRLARLGAGLRRSSRLAWRGATRFIGSGLGSVAGRAAGLLGRVPGMARIGTVLRAAAPMVLHFGRALLMAMGPIGWTIAAVAALAYGGYYLWKNWDTIGPKIKKGWAVVVGAVGWAWDSTKRYVRGFVQAGSDLVGGFIGGITQRWDQVKTTVSNMGSSALTSIKNVLGIKSPSRKMMEVGHNVAEGAAIGIEQRSHLVRKQSDRLAGLMLAKPPTQAVRALPAWVTDTAGMAALPGAGHTTKIEIHYAPIIKINGSADPNQIRALLADDKESFFRNFEQHYQRMMRDANRRSLGGA
jgi:TP901 family phage tail tape measure protein